MVRKLYDSHKSSRGEVISLIVSTLLFAATLFALGVGAYVAGAFQPAMETCTPEQTASTAAPQG